jgi:predicted nucleic acid-binding protein
VIFVDANVFIRHLVDPATSHDAAHAEQAATLFAAVGVGAVEVTTSEAVLAEVVFILWHPRHYGAPRGAVAGALSSLLQPRAFRMPGKDVCLAALERWARSPRLSFPDALGAAYSELRGHELATFDSELARTPGVVPYAFGRPT